MKMNKCKEIPTERWGLEKLGRFCSGRHQRLAIDAWLIGKAMWLAKDRCKSEGKEFTSWKKEHRFSNASASRYMRLFKSHQTEEQLQHLQSAGLLETYIDAGIEAPRERKPRQSSDDDTGPTEPDEANVESGPPSWAVPDLDELRSEQDAAPQTIALIPVKDCVEHELREVVPWQIVQLKEKIGFLMGQDVELLRAARPAKECDRSRVAGEIDALVALLSRLAATLRGVPASQSAERTKQRKTTAA